MLTATQFNNLKTDLQNWLNCIDTTTPIEPHYLTMRIKLESAFRYLCHHSSIAKTITDVAQDTFSKMAYNSTLKKTTISQAEKQELTQILQDILQTVLEWHTSPPTSDINAALHADIPMPKYSSHASLDDAHIGPGDTPIEVFHRMFMTVTMTTPETRKRSIRQLSGEAPAKTSTAKRAQPTDKGGLGQDKQAPELASTRKELSASKKPRTFQAIPTDALEKMFTHETGAPKVSMRAPTPNDDDSSSDYSPRRDP